MKTAPERYSTAGVVLPRRGASTTPAHTPGGGLHGLLETRARPGVRLAVANETLSTEPAFFAMREGVHRLADDGAECLSAALRAGHGIVDGARLGFDGAEHDLEQKASFDG